MLLKELIQQLEFLLDNHFGNKIKVERYEPVYGGDINETFVLYTTAEKYFLKVNKDVREDMFMKEFNGLKTLLKSNTISVPMPVVCGSFRESIFLVMEYIKKGNPRAGFWQCFAEGLANLHRNTQRQFGFNESNYIGSVAQLNDLKKTWAEFYATMRIMPLMIQAYEAKKCTESDLAKAEKLCCRLPQLFPDEAPALLHGDLWSGNFMVRQEGVPVIYDPAVYYGNREMDIAMTMLFGGFDKNFYRYYNEIFPLQKGWEDRIMPVVSFVSPPQFIWWALLFQRGKKYKFVSLIITFKNLLRKLTCFLMQWLNQLLLQHSAHHPIQSKQRNILV